MTRPSRMPLFWSEGFRSLACMLPMLAASALNKTSTLVALGQGGFYFSSLFLPAKIGARLMMGSILVSLGMGLYLIGGNVAESPVVAVAFTAIIAIVLSFLSNWKSGGVLALTFIMIFTAGLNTGSPEKATTNFLLFAGVLSWSTLISMLPIWKPTGMPPSGELENSEYAEQGVRMGVGAGLALAVSYVFDFGKLGWAPSAVGYVVRYDEKMSKLRAKARVLATIAGAILAMTAIFITTNLTILIYVSVIFAFINGLLKLTTLGKMPLFYTSTILILYSLNDISEGRAIAINRIAYNMIGVLIGLAVIYYPFPKLLRLVKKATA